MAQDTYSKKIRATSGKLILLMFSLCALGDSLWSYIERRSIAEAIMSAVFGLFGTACYVFLFLMLPKRRPNSD